MTILRFEGLRFEGLRFEGRAGVASRSLLAAAHAAFSLWACGAPRAEAPLSTGSELPVTRVVLYQNGVGYFERSGSVDAEVFTLTVRPSQINDLLKSLTVIDAGNGRAVSASLPLEQSADRLLSELPEQVRSAGGLLDVLRLFRGAHVEIEGDGGSAEGRVIGVEDLEAGRQGEVAADWRVSLKTDDDEVVVYPVARIRRVMLEDATLSVGLERSLDVSLGEGGWKPIGLSIRLAGETPHRIFASYIVEMPRWKPAYRLVLSPGQKPLLQGWAVVDNVSGEHWRDVSLSLVSGAPISFKYNLHAPQYTERADLTPAGLPRAAAPPPEEEPGFEDAPPPPPPAPSAAPAHGMPSAKKKDAGDEEQAEREEGYTYSFKADAFGEQARGGAAPPVDLGATLEAFGEQAQATQVGALFRYDVRDPVTIPDRSSTLVNIVNQRIDGEEIAYFRPELAESGAELHPYRAVKLDNSTGSTLERGPITLYSNGTFVGEGFVERLERGATSFLTFALDGSISLDQHGGSRDESLRLVRIQDGVLETLAQRTEVTKYEVRNRREEPVRAYIKSMKLHGWTLRQRPNGTVDTPEALIVPLDVPAAGSAKIEVAWQQPVSRNIAVDSAEAGEVLQLYLQGGKAPPALERVIRQVLEIKAEIAAKRKEEGRLDAQHSALSRDLERVRDNINVLRRTRGNAELERELAQKLGKLERDLGAISGRRVELSEAIAELEAKLTVLIREVSFDVSE